MLNRINFDRIKENGGINSWKGFTYDEILSWIQKNDHVGKEAGGKVIQVEGAAYIKYWKYASGSVRKSDKHILSPIDLITWNT